MGIKTECFAYDTKEKGCRCLKELYCQKEKCHFYKDKTQINQAHINSAIRSYSKGK